MEKEGIINEELEDKKSPFVYIMSVFLILLMVLWIVPHYGVKLDPSPKTIPKIEDVVTEVQLKDINNHLISRDEFRRFIYPNDPFVKQTASKIVSLACLDSSKVCHAKAIFYFVRDNLMYVGDPPDEYIETLEEALLTGTSDCDGHAVALASLMEAVGINSELVFIPGHVFVRIMVPGARNAYKLDDWIYLEPTCKTCEFGQIPYQNVEKEKQILKV